MTRLFLLLLALATPLGTVTIPRMELADAPVVALTHAGGRWDMDAVGADVGLAVATNGTVGLFAHDWAAFKGLPMLVAGDRVTLALDGQGARAFIVVGAGLVHARDLSRFDGRWDLVLVTCTTYGPDWRWAAWAVEEP